MRYLCETKQPGLGETDTEKMTFPVLGLKPAIEAFTESTYGKRMNFEHA